MTVNLSRNLHPMRLSRRSAPFNSDDFIFELKIDGFRSLAFVENGQCDLLSRNENTFHNFKHFTQWIGENLRVANAVLDGEIACVDQYGRSVFNDLLFGGVNVSSLPLIFCFSTVMIYAMCRWSRGKPG